MENFLINSLAISDDFKHFSFFQKTDPTITTSGRKVSEAVREKNAVNSVNIVTAHASCLDQC